MTLESSDSSYHVSSPEGQAGGGQVVWRRLLQYPSQAMFFALAVVCLGGFLLLGSVAWRMPRQLERIEIEMQHGADLEQMRGLLRHLLAEQRAGAQVQDPVALAQLRSELAAMRTGWLDLRLPESENLDRLSAALANAGPKGGELESAGRILDEVVREEASARGRLMATMRADALAELRTATGLFVALALLGLGGAWTVQRRVLRPLQDLRAMFRKLAAGDFGPVALTGVHPVLTPLFDNYNRLVTRLQELEEEHRSRAESLEKEVRAASETLLAQQRSLTHAERLAAVGEMAAGLAHELRNPIAGVQMALTNLRRDLDDPQLASRLELAIAELERLTRLLNHQLSASRHVPEPSRRLHLGTLVEDLLALLRYQVPAHIRLGARVDDAIQCQLPRDRVRQALLNLVLNSVQAMGDQAGHVQVDARREGERVVLVVTDDGPGFPPALVKAGGQPFVTHRNGGTGLGLAMVRRLAMDLGGQLSLENLDPRGARVRLELPCEDDA